MQPEQLPLWVGGKRGGDGKSIQEARLDDEGHLVIRYTDGTEWRSDQSLRGRDGRGIREASLNLEDHLVLKFTDDAAWTSDRSLRGSQGPAGESTIGPAGPQGLPGLPGRPGRDGRGIHQVKLTKEGYLWFEFSDVTYWDSGPQSLFGQTAQPDETGLGGLGADLCFRRPRS